MESLNKMTTTWTLFKTLGAFTLFFIDICGAFPHVAEPKITISKQLDPDKTSVLWDKEQKLSLFDSFHGASIVGPLPLADANRQQHQTFENKHRNEESNTSKIGDAPFAEDERSIVDAFDHASVVGPPRIIQQWYESMFHQLMGDSTTPLDDADSPKQLEQIFKLDVTVTKEKNLKPQAAAAKSKRKVSPMDAFDQANMIAFYDSTSVSVSAGMRSSSTTSTVLRHRRLPALNEKSLAKDPITGVSLRYIRNLEQSSNTAKNVNTKSVFSPFWICVVGVIVMITTIVIMATGGSASCLHKKRQENVDVFRKDGDVEVNDLEGIPAKELENKSTNDPMRTSENVVRVYPSLDNQPLSVICEEEEEATEVNAKLGTSVPISKLFSLILDVLHEFESKKTHNDEPETSETSEDSSSVFFENDDDVDKIPARMAQTYLEEDAGIPAWIEFQRCDEYDEEQPERISSLGTDRLSCGKMRLEV
jgi:hypothetical protein